MRPDGRTTLWRAESQAWTHAARYSKAVAARLPAPTGAVHPAMLIIVTFVTLMVGSVIKGAAGLGLPLIAIPALSLFVGVPQALSIVLIPMVVTNAFQVWQFRRVRNEVHLLPRFLVFGVVGIAGGTVLLSIASPQALEVGLAVAVLAYLALRLTRPDFHLSPTAGVRFAPPVGLSAGLLQGATGIAGPIGATFFHSLGLSRDGFMFCTATMFLAFSSSQLFLLTVSGIAEPGSLALGLFALLPSFAGLTLGDRLGRSLSPVVFGRLIMVILSATVLPLLYRGIFG